MSLAQISINKGEAAYMNSHGASSAKAFIKHSTHRRQRYAAKQVLAQFRSTFRKSLDFTSLNMLEYCYDQASREAKIQADFINRVSQRGCGARAFTADDLVTLQSLCDSRFVRFA